MKFKTAAAGVAVAMLAIAASVTFAATEKKDVPAIEKAVGGSWRSADSKSRDVYRHPVEALEFWALRPA